MPDRIIPGRRPGSLWPPVLGLVLLLLLAGVAVVAIDRSPSTSAGPVFSLGTPRSFSNGTSWYTQVPLLNANLTGVDEIGLSLLSGRAPLPSAYLALAPWVNDFLCGGGALLPGMLSWTSNVTHCEAMRGYWYALLTNSTGSVLAINAIVVSSSAPSVPGPSWFAANSTASIVSSGSALVLVTAEPLTQTGYELVVGDAGRTASLDLGSPSTPVPTFLMDYPVSSQLCPQKFQGSGPESASDNVSFNVSTTMSLLGLELNLTSGNHSLWAVNVTGYQTCPILPDAPAQEEGYFAILWFAPYRPVAYYSVGPQGPRWSALNSGPVPTLSPSLDLTLELLSWGGLTSPALSSHLTLGDAESPMAESWGGTLTNGVGVLLP